MISAMYENGGNTTQRILDGHENLFVYPFESQPGTKFVNDHLSSMFPLKYRWPIFPNSATPEEIYKMIIDEEGKVRLRTPFVSKFKDADLKMTDEDREKIFIKLLSKADLTRSNIMEAFFRSTFEAWKNYNNSGKEIWYVGYSPIIGVDGDKIINDYKENGLVLHVIRNPFSAFADTKKRAVPLSLDHYITGWMINQYYATYYAEKYPKNFFVIKYEDIIKNRKKAFEKILARMKISFKETMSYPSWNSQELEKVYPWGTIKTPTEEINLKTARELSEEEKNNIFSRTKNYIDLLGYNKLAKEIGLKRN